MEVIGICLARTLIHNKNSRYFSVEENCSKLIKISSLTFIIEKICIVKRHNKRNGIQEK